MTKKKKTKTIYETLSDDAVAVYVRLFYKGSESVTRPVNDHPGNVVTFHPRTGKALVELLKHKMCVEEDAGRSNNSVQLRGVDGHKEGILERIGPDQITFMADPTHHFQTYITRP